MRNLFYTVLAGLVLASPLGVQADLSVDASEAKPAVGSALLEVKRVGETRGNWRWFRTGNDEQRARRDVGQIFVAPGEGESVSIGSLLIQVGDVEVGAGAYGAEIALSFYDYDEGVVGAVPVGEAKGRLPERFAPKDYLHLRFPPVVLRPGKRYAFVLRYESPAGGRSINIETASKRDYKQGNGLFYGLKPETEGPLEFFEVEGNIAFAFF